ncbi:MAG: ABC transporter ATP-binding protein [Bacillota bacterium]
MAQSSNNMIEVNNLKKYFPLRKGIFSKVVAHVKAVDNINFFIREGETFGLVGESGCGKTTTGRLILRLLKPTEGTVTFCGKNLTNLPSQEMQRLRREIQIIFQDPYSSLNPRMTIGQIIGEPLKVHNIAYGKEKEKRIMDIVEVVGLGPHHINRYPHEFSGGQRQRIGIARALILNPRLIICDEPVSALDVSIQSQVINLLEDLQKEFGLTYLFISHDLGVVKHISNRIGVMYLGRLVEVADKEELFDNPKHPYTQALLSAIPIPDPDAIRERIILKGDVPNPIDPPPGCRFQQRCWLKENRCCLEDPDLLNIGKEHWVACYQV